MADRSGFRSRNRHNSIARDSSFQTLSIIRRLNRLNRTLDRNRWPLTSIGDHMQLFFKVQGRALGFLREDHPAAAGLCAANVALVGASFLEPVLFGHVVPGLSA